MKKLKYLIVSVMILLLSAVSYTTALGETKYTMAISSSATATSGSNVTFTFSAKDLASIASGFDGYQCNIEYDNTKLSYVSGTGSLSGWKFKATDKSTKIIVLGYDEDAPDNNKKTDSEIFKVTFKVASGITGTTTITASSVKGTSSNGVSLVADSVSKTITITEPAPTPITKSSDANLSNLSASGYTLSPAFSAATTSYKVTVPNDATKIDVTAIPNDSKASVSISGNTNLSVGTNNVIVQVTAENGNKKVYTIEVTRQKADDPAPTPVPEPTPSEPVKEKPKTTTTTSKSSNNKLKSVTGLDGLNFNPDQTNYDVEVPFEVSSVNLVAVPESSKASVTISNNNLKGMEIGKNYTMTISVKAEDGSIRVYTINVKRSQYRSETDLKELVVDDIDLIKTEGKKDEYVVNVDKKTDNIDINAIPVNEGSSVKIIGNKNLKNGNNKVVVEVTDKNGFKKNYVINVRRGYNPFLEFLKNWWPLLLMIIMLLILMYLMWLSRRNKLMLAGIENDEPEEENETSIRDINIDNKKYIYYNSNNGNVIGEDDDNYQLKHHSDNKLIDNILDNDSVKEFTKEYKIVTDEDDDEDYEKEYKIEEKYRKK